MFFETAGFSSDATYRTFPSIFSEDGLVFAVFTAELCGKLLSKNYVIIPIQLFRK